MQTFLIRRLLSFVAVLLAVTAIVFGLVHLTGDPVVLMLAGTGASEEELNILRERLGYDEPVQKQYWEFLKGLAKGQMGQSLFYQTPALSLVLDRTPATIKLALVAMLIATAAGVPLGMLSAVKHGTAWDHIGTALALVGQSVPAFWLAIMSMLVFAVKLGWLPASGMGTPKHFILPALTLSTGALARFVRITRSSMLECIHQSYTNTARAKGLREIYVITRHVLKNAAIPVTTVGGLILGELLGGSVITETVFGWPGVAQLTVQAVYNRDLPLVQACVFTVALGYLVANLLVDLTYAYLDPRIRYE
jgi:ABC-type dipeptide/oligopeptide/nickel transport system permease component